MTFRIWKYHIVERAIGLVVSLEHFDDGLLLENRAKRFVFTGKA